MNSMSAIVGVVLALAGAGLGGATDSGTPHPFSIHDMLAMDRISDPAVSPDGSQTLYTLRSTDMETNGGRTDLWVVPVAGGAARRLTTSPDSDYHGRWSPDGRTIWFLSTRSGGAQIWRLPVGGGEAEAFTDLPLDVGNLVVGPQGRSIAFTMNVFPNSSVTETRTRLDAEEARPSSGQIHDRIFVRHWDTWKDGRRSHLFVLPTAETREDPRDVMRGMDADTPSLPFGGAEEMTFTPDGRGVVFSARIAGSTEPWSTNFDLFLAPIDGSGAPKNLTAQNPAWDTHPVFSPDGRFLAYLAMARAGYESDRRRIVLRDWSSGESRVLAEDWDRSPRSLCWSADSKTLFVTAADTGQTPLFSVDVSRGDVRKIVREGSVRSVAHVGKSLVYGLNHLQSPTELYRTDLRGRRKEALTQHNREQLMQCRMGAFEQFSFSGWNDETVYGFVVKPVDFKPERTYPVVFLIHGGPQGSFGNNFHYRWNPQAYAGAGYAAVMIDFHGSVGYGQAFTDSIRGDWGGKPLVDLQLGLAAALARYPWLDKSRIGALGGSFGGYMVNWIAGQWPDRFRCLVNHDGNLDERMAYFDTEELWFPEWDHEGTPWENPRAYEKHNPVNYVQNWKTPMLVIHGAQDYRVVDTQGLGTFNALQRQGIPSRLLYFPDENHWVLKPHNSVLWYETVLNWLDQWVKP